MEDLHGGYGCPSDCCLVKSVRYLINNWADCIKLPWIEHWCKVVLVVFTRFSRSQQSIMSIIRHILTFTLEGYIVYVCKSDIDLIARWTRAIRLSHNQKQIFVSSEVKNKVLSTQFLHAFSRSIYFIFS